MQHVLKFIAIKWSQNVYFLNTLTVETVIVGDFMYTLLMRKLTYVHFIINPANLKDPDLYEARTRCHPATAPINLRGL